MYGIVRDLNLHALPLLALHSSTHLHLQPRPHAHGDVQRPPGASASARDNQRDRRLAQGKLSPRPKTYLWSPCQGSARLRRQRSTQGAYALHRSPLSALGAHQPPQAGALVLRRVPTSDTSGHATGAQGLLLRPGCRRTPSADRRGHPQAAGALRAPLVFGREAAEVHSAVTCAARRAVNGWSHDTGRVLLL